MRAKRSRGMVTSTWGESSRMLYTLRGGYFSSKDSAKLRRRRKLNPNSAS